ncbi:uncharacterized protein FFUJ_14163 [Fusarium fujikuroi IMI 58289]|uniref:Uncharacterized protein n=1 Tax=Gibberella fujikuroi (strain CBS 195.34 / IMI 58289 / NRRL A-6831) TaxID=1279085 RepID=S0EP80_GIBF5|nr:uncharacterized protein FFUJ_14163 [Fusarium fujikuroi IMI 58289]CCT76204.1 uncharacterized protein FFUJ_14163 [Fusarium fujikuroi IMI 58289]SCO26771.1 uncharacterized protein FFM5_15040 [Fusarium fujikuroi]SCV57626.1 uncharacterized protein FFB14_15241 [Fusarium fujikuroi]
MTKKTMRKRRRRNIRSGGGSGSCWCKFGSKNEVRWVLLEAISPDSLYPFSHIFQVCAIWFDVLLFVCAIMLVLLWLCRVDPPKCRSVTIIRNRPCAELLGPLMVSEKPV